MIKRFSTLDIGVGEKELEAEVEQCMQDVGAAESMDTAAIATVADFTHGAILKGRVVNVMGNDVVVEVGLKSEGTIDISEFSEPEKIVPGMEVRDASAAGSRISEVFP